MDNHIATPASQSLLLPSSGDVTTLTAVSSLCHGSSSSHNVQGSPLASLSAPVSVPIILVSPEPIASENLALVKMNAAIQPIDPAPIAPLYSSTVFYKTLSIVKEILGSLDLPQLDIANFTSESSEENIGAILDSIHCAQQDKMKGRSLVVYRLGGILPTVESYMGAVGAALQQIPIVGGSVCLCLRAIMQVRIECTILLIKTTSY